MSQTQRWARIVRFNNRIDCVGTIYELSLTIARNNDIPYVKGAIVVKTGNKYIRFYINTPKYNRLEYYTILETLGVPYEVIRKCDEDKYYMYEKPAMCELEGLINGWKLSTLYPTRVYLTATLTSYGYKMHHISRVDNKDKDVLSFNIDGSPYDTDRFILPSIEDILEIECDKGFKKDRYGRYQLSVAYMENECNNERIYDIRRPHLIIKDIAKVGQYPKKLIDDIVILRG